MSRQLFIHLCLGLSFFLLLVSCTSRKPISNLIPVPSHEIWDELLKSHVNDAGEVDYAGFIQEKEKLNSYLDLLQAHPPQPNRWSRAERMAYWINAYNAFTVQIVTEHFPVESIKDIGPGLAIPFVNTVWDIKFIFIDGKKNEPQPNRAWQTQETIP